MTRRIGAVAGALALELIALVLAHDLTFLARFGSRYGEELVHAGHGQAWTTAVDSSVVLAVLLAVLGVGRLVHLAATARRLGAAPLSTRRAEEVQTFVRAWAGLGIRVGLVTVVLLTVQENVERASIGQPAPGPGLLLSPQYPFGIWIAGGVSGLVAFVAALFRHRVRLLLARIRRIRASFGRATSDDPIRRGVELVQPLESILGRRSGLRAPPLRPTA